MLPYLADELDDCMADPQCTVVQPDGFGPDGFDTGGSFQQAHDAVSAGVGIIGVIVVLVIVAGIAIVAYLATRARRAPGIAGVNHDLAAAGNAIIGNTPAPQAPDAPAQQRLDELARLRDAGTITADEHDAARARILAES